MPRKVISMGRIVPNACEAFKDPEGIKKNLRPVRCGATFGPMKTTKHILMSCVPILTFSLLACTPVREPPEKSSKSTLKKSVKSKDSRPATAKASNTKTAKASTPETAIAMKKSIPAPPDVAAPPADAKKTASGLASKVIKAGTGSSNPGPTSNVQVHYTGWTTDGKMFDSSVTRGRPATFPLNRVIPGWTEGLQLMVAGEKRRLWIPEDLAYKGRKGPPAGMLVFDVELLAIMD